MGKRIRKTAGTEPVPDYMQGHAGRGVENLGPEDCAWLGKDGNIDPDEILKANGYDPDPPLELILGAIIDAHPAKDSRQDRLENALEALTGVKRKRGMNSKNDYDLLLQIAWEYHVAHLNGEEYETEVAPIAKRVIERLPPNDPRKPRAGLISVIRRLVRKFNKDRDLLLTRATSQMDWFRMHDVNAIRDVVKKIEELGIPANVGSVKPRLFPADEIPYQ